MIDRLQVTEDDVQAYADGRLAADRRTDVESWLAGRPADAERVVAYKRLNEELRALYDPVLEESVPERLHTAPPAGRRLRAAAAVLAWLALGAAIGAAAGWRLHQPGAGVLVQDGVPAFVRRAAIAHATYSPEVRHPVEVGADQEAHLVAWLSKRLGATVRAPKLQAAGFSLVGGRLLPGESGPVAYLMYQSAQGARITLYVRTEGPKQLATAFRFAREGNVSVFYWIDHDFAYALSSIDVSRAELLHVATLVYQQLNP